MMVASSWRNAAILILLAALNGFAAPSANELLQALTTNRCNPASFAASIEAYVGRPGAQTKQRFNLRGFAQDDFFYASYVSANYKLPTVAGGGVSEQWHVSGHVLAVYNEPGRYLVDRRIKNLLEHLNFRSVMTCLALGTNFIVSDTAEQVRVEGTPPDAPAFRMVRRFTVIFDKRFSLLPTQLHLLYEPMRSPTNSVTIDYGAFRNVDDKWFPGSISGHSDLDGSSFVFTIPNLTIAPPKDSEAFKAPVSGSSNWLTGARIEYDTRLVASSPKTGSNDLTDVIPVSLTGETTSNGIAWAESSLEDTLIPGHSMALLNDLQTSEREINFGWLAGILAAGLVVVVCFASVLWRKKAMPNT
jgi:hypothetical protein